MRFVVYLILLLCVGLTTSCKEAPGKTSPEFDLHDDILFNNTDSLASLLETVVNPATLPDKDKADYGYSLTYLHNRQRRSLINDTLIHFAVKYYEEHPSPRLFNAYLLGGMQANWAGENAKAETLLNKSLQEAKLQQDTALMRYAQTQLILFYSQTGEHFKEIELSKDLYEIAPDDFLYFPLISIAGAYSKLKDVVPGAPDSIIKYTQMGIDRGVSNPNLKRIQASAYTLTGEDEKALEMLRALRKEFPAETIINTNFIPVWFNLNQADSAKAYMDELTAILSGVTDYPEETEPLLFTLKAFQLVYDEMKGYPITIWDIGNYNDEIMKKNNRRMKNDRERQFTQFQLAQHNLRLDIERGELRQRLLRILAGVFVVLIFLIYFYQRKLLMKERSIQQIRQQLQTHLLELNENRTIIDKNEQLIQALNNQLNESEDVKESLQEQRVDIARFAAENERLKRKNEYLLRDINSYSSALQEKDEAILSYERLTSQNRLLQERERFLTSQLVNNIDTLRQLRLKPKYIEEDQWPEIINIVDMLYDNFLYRLRTDYSMLTEDDLHYCALIKLGFSNPVMAALTAVSPSSVTKRKQRIKERMRQERPENLNKEEPLEIYLWSY